MCRNYHPKRPGVATRQCGPGNGAVPSAGNNVTQRLAIKPTGASQGAHGKPGSEGVVNSVIRDRRKDSCYAGAKIGVLLGGGTRLLPPCRSTCSRRTAPTYRHRRKSPTRNLVSPTGPASQGGGIPTARKGEDPVGKGGWKKRRPCCNGTDRAAAQAVGIPSSKGRPLPAGLGGRRNSWTGITRGDIRRWEI